MGVLGAALHTLHGAGLDAVREVVSHVCLRYGASLEADPVLEADWDLLVVLDACRADLWAEVAGDVDDVPVGETRISPGGTSVEWMETVFDGERTALHDVGYVTANPYSARHVPGDRLAHLEEVWRADWDDDRGTVPPRPVTDAAVRVGREHAVDRLIVHYMQPHFPSLADSHDDGVTLDTFGDTTLSVWEDLRVGARTHEEVWDAYAANLRIVLDDVRLLLDNVDADRVVITADHGNAMGERHIHGHAAGLALRPLREVPWAVTTAADHGTHHPTTAPAEPPDPSVDERLRALGYR